MEILNYKPTISNFILSYQTSPRHFHLLTFISLANQSQPTRCISLAFRFIHLCPSKLYSPETKRTWQELPHIQSSFYETKCSSKQAKLLKRKANLLINTTIRVLKLILLLYRFVWLWEPSLFDNCKLCT